jgi:hypothetical protein
MGPRSLACSQSRCGPGSLARTGVSGLVAILVFVVLPLLLLLLLPLRGLRRGRRFGRHVAGTRRPTVTRPVPVRSIEPVVGHPIGLRRRRRGRPTRLVLLLLGALRRGPAVLRVPIGMVHAPSGCRSRTRRGGRIFASPWERKTVGTAWATKIRA